MRLEACDPIVLIHFKAKIDAIGIAQNEPDLYDRVYSECVNKKSFVFISKTESGCIVLTPIVGPGVLIWIAVSDTKADVRAYLDDIEHLAACIHADFIQLYTLRKGFKRVLPAHGYAEHSVELEGRPFSCWRKDLWNYNQQEVTHGIKSQTGV